MIKYTCLEKFDCNYISNDYHGFKTNCDDFQISFSRDANRNCCIDIYNIVLYGDNKMTEKFKPLLDEYIQIEEEHTSFLNQKPKTPIYGPQPSCEEIENQFDEKFKLIRNKIKNTAIEILMNYFANNPNTFLNYVEHIKEIGSKKGQIIKEKEIKRCLNIRDY